MSTIRFEAQLQSLEKRVVLRLPREASQALGSRGQVAVEGSFNGQPFETVLEPDGEFGHWMRVEAEQLRSTSARVGDLARVEVEPTRDWPEPVVPEDLATALAGAPEKIRAMWHDITPMARWEWVRWVNATRNPDTRRRRVEVSLSKMDGGKRRPCCFNLAACTDPDLARSGKLIGPD